jgi:hypothetical protein
MSGIVQDVTQGIPHFERRFQSARVVTVRENGTATAGAAVDGSGNANRQALNAAPQRSAVCGFGDQMDVIALNGVLAQAKPEPLAPSDERAMNPQE